MFAQYPDVSGLLLMLRIEGARRQAIETLRQAPSLGSRILTEAENRTARPRGTSQ